MNKNTNAQTIVDMLHTRVQKKKTREVIYTLRLPLWFQTRKLSETHDADMILGAITAGVLIIRWRKQRRVLRELIRCINHIWIKVRYCWIDVEPSHLHWVSTIAHLIIRMRVCPTAVAKLHNQNTN